MRSAEVNKAHGMSEVPPEVFEAKNISMAQMGKMILQLLTAVAAQSIQLLKCDAVPCIREATKACV